jgi:wyosine [tRNA(Phe)-imidazoG37] synthetase (radical SAM superfamily)
MQYTYLFGPVSSRRLGRSLGIDLVPFKFCTYDCVYCECGSTTQETLWRQEFFPEDRVIEEISRYLSASPDLDFITFSGSGEPTLSLSIGKVIRFIKKEFPPYRVAVLTNGSLLPDPAVREDLLLADVVLPTLSTVSEETFRKIHRPVPEISCADTLEGLIRFRGEYKGEIRLEVFIIPGLNTSDKELAGLREAIRRIRPDRIQLNTLDRPGVEDWVRPADPAELGRIAAVLEYPGTEIARFPGAGGPRSPYAGNLVEQICEMLRRRPSTAGDIAAATGMRRTEVEKILREISAARNLRMKREERGLFYYLR